MDRTATHKIERFNAAATSTLRRDGSVTRAKVGKGIISISDVANFRT